MLAPIDKIEAGGNDTIQIVVTRACSLALCSNCTQLLPFRRDALHMSLECFRAAVESVKDWPGIVAMFGGNPCNHPQFPELCRILAEHVRPERRGLWTNDLRQHGEIAAETFGKGRLNLNAHADPEAAAGFDRWFPGRIIESSRSRASWHSPILLHWHDMGLTLQEWHDARERCDINQRWSGAIVERDGNPFAYFCEVASALDGIRGENHGVPAVPGWWRERMNGYGDQVSACCDRGCGIPLNRLGQLDRDDTYDYSASFAPLVEMRIKGTLKGARHDAMPAATESPTDYQALRSVKA